MNELSYPQTDAVVIPFAPDYSITPCGTVRRVKRDARNRQPKALKGSVAKNGYRMICLTINGIERHMLLHRVVARVFLGEPPEDKPFACHKDGDKSHNHAANLRWDDAFGNMADKVKHGTLQCGERNGNAALTGEAIREILSTPYRYGIWAELARKFGVTKSAITSVRKGRSWSYAAQALEPPPEAR